VWREGSNINALCDSVGSFFASRLCFNYVFVNQIMVSWMYVKAARYQIEAHNYLRGASVLQPHLCASFPLLYLV